MLGPQYLSPSAEKPRPDFWPSPTKPDTRKLGQIDFSCTVAMISELEILIWPSLSPRIFNQFKLYSGPIRPPVTRPEIRNFNKR